MNIARRGALIAGAGLVSTLLAMVLAPAPTTNAHNTTLLAPYTTTVCRGAQSAYYYTLYGFVGPQNKTWTVNTQIGLSGGDALQNVVFLYYLEDSYLAERIGEYGVPVRDWVSISGGNKFGSAITTQAGGNLSVELYLWNQDVNSQCFTIYARAGYQ